MNPTDPDALRNFLEMNYRELEEKNLEMKRLAESSKSKKALQDKVTKFLKEIKSVKAVTIAFSDLEGKLHMLDYDKNYFLNSNDNLTFDGSSVRGFSEITSSDLRLEPDWGSFRILPADVFGAGKVLLFGFVCNHDGSRFSSDFRGRLAALTEELKKKNMTVYMAPEIEGFLFAGVDAEQRFDQNKGFKLVTAGGYFNALPRDEMRQFIDKVAEVQRALGFENEKDHGEVAPSQFEINFRYAEVLTACDEVLIYKLTARQVAKLMGFTASFLPKPATGINGSGMHTNLSISKNGKNIFWDKVGKNHLSKCAHDFIQNILQHAQELCLAICPSVNGYRRLDPHFEAPNEIKVSPCDRSSMIRIPIGNEHSARIEFRSVSPDCNPYLALFIMLHVGLQPVKKAPLPQGKKLPGTLDESLTIFKRSVLMKKILGSNDHEKYIALKNISANRAPRELGKRVKQTEVIHHHEVTNQILWSEF